MVQHLRYLSTCPICTLGAACDHSPKQSTGVHHPNSTPQTYLQATVQVYCSGGVLKWILRAAAAAVRIHSSIQQQIHPKASIASAKQDAGNNQHFD